MVPSRRAALGACGSAVAALLAGCLGGAGSTATPTDPPTPRVVGSPDSPADPPTTPATTGSPMTATPTTVAAAAEGVSVAWSADLGSRLSRPAVAGGSVYVATSEGPVHALSVAGERRWRFPRGGSHWHAPAVADGTVYVGEEALYALDAGDGSERWRHGWAGNTSSTPVVHDGTVIVGNTDPPTSHTESEYPEDLWGLDAADGSVRWKRDLGAHPAEELSGTPVLADGRLYAQMWDSGRVYALDPADGTTVWERDLGTSNGHPAYDGGRLFVAAADGIEALDPGSGETLWRAEGFETAPVAAAGTVYAGSWDGTATVEALDAATGEERWSVERAGELRSWSALAATPGGVLVDTFHRGRGTAADNATVMYGFAADDGAQRLRFARRAGLFSRPTPAGDRVYVGSASGRLFALSAG